MNSLLTLHAIEQQYFMTEIPIEDEVEGEIPEQVCLLNCWGDSLEEYVKNFGDVCNKVYYDSKDTTITEQEKVIGELVDKIQLNTEILTAIMERKPLQGSDYHAISCTIKNNELLIAKHKQSKG